MDFFPGPNPKTFASSPRIYDLKGDEARYELDYIPFAKSSSTIVKQAGFDTMTTAASNFLPKQQSYDDRWGSEFPDDARVPRLSGSYQENSPTSDMMGHAFLSQGQGNNMDSSLGPTLAFGAINNLTGSSMLNSGGSGVILSAPFRSLGPDPHLSRPTSVPMSMHLPLLHQSPSQMTQQELSATTGVSGRNDGNGEAFEVVVEMPPSLANPRALKVNRPSRLNDKYARMKSDMELIAQPSYPYPRVVRHQYDRPTVSAPWNDVASQRPFGHLPVSIQSAPGPICSSQSAPMQQILGQPRLAGGSTRGISTEMQQLETKPRNPPTQPPTKRVRIEGNLPSNRVSMSRVTGGGSTVVRRGGVGIGGSGAFSTPHFRMSTPARATEVSNPSSHLLLPAKISQGARRAEDILAMREEEGDGCDDWGLKDFLLDPEPLLVPSPNTTPDSKGYGNRFAATVVTTTTLTNNNNINYNGSGSSLYGHSPRLQQSKKEPFVDYGLSQKTPDQIAGQDVPPEQDPILYSAVSAAVLDDRPMTLLERIHRMGSEMRASAVATVPRFPAMRGRATREERAGQVQDQYQNQEQQHPQQQQRRRSQSSEVEFSSTTVIGRRGEAEIGGDRTIPDTKLLANELAPVPQDIPLAADIQSLTSPLSSQQYVPGSKRDGCSGDATESLAPDMSFLAEIEQEILGLADFE